LNASFRVSGECVSSGRGERASEIDRVLGVW
jgi:hypothetical protein